MLLRRSLLAVSGMILAFSRCQAANADCLPAPKSSSITSGYEGLLKDRTATRAVESRLRVIPYLE